MHFWTTGSNMETVVYFYGFEKRHPPSSSSGTSPLLFSEAGMTVLTLFAFRFGRMVRWLAGREAEGPWRDKRGRDDGLELVWRWFGVDLAASRRRLLPAIHLAPESAFQGPPGHISSRDELQEDY